MCPISSVLFQNSFFFWLQTFLCNNLKTRDGGVPCWAASSRWQLQGSWERLSCSNLQMVRGESRTGHGEGWRRWCVTCGPGIIQIETWCHYVKASFDPTRSNCDWKPPLAWRMTPMGREKSNMDKLNQSSIQIIQVQSLQGFSGTTEVAGWTFWPSKDKCNNFINLPFSPHLKPIPAPVGAVQSSWTSSHSSPLNASRLPSFLATSKELRHKETVVNGGEFIWPVLIEWI